METIKRDSLRPYGMLNKCVTAVSLVVAGLVIMGHNVGMVSDYFFRIIISWQMLLVVWGITLLFKHNFLSGAVPLAMGVYFLLPRITGEESVWLSTYWPAFLVLIGLLILFSRRKNPWHIWSNSGFHLGNRRGRGVEQITDGYVTANVSFGSSRHSVLDPVFRGADLDASFGTMSLDLRRTSLEAPEAYINVDCSFGGVVIFVPPHWCLFSVMDNSFGSSEDKRYQSQETDTEHKLIIRGDVSFGALEIKN
jgi:hypothetical protein